MNPECIFCKIVAGQIPSTRVYEDEDTLAFMDIGPIVRGHTLVIPKQHYDPITNLPDALLAKVVAVAKRIAGAQLKGLHADGVNLFQANGSSAGQVVPHVHFHVIPRFQADGHKWNWAAGKYDNLDQMQALADAIRQAME